MKGGDRLGAWPLAILLASGAGMASCAHTLGYAGSHPGYVKCVGKGSITGTGSAGIGAGMGGGELNTFTIQADCGDGFTFEQGMPVPISPLPTLPPKGP